MKNDILLIYPQDVTTDFLQGIPDFLFKRHGEHRFVHHRIGMSETDTQSCISGIEQAANDTFIIFLGHGSSLGFMGARGEESGPELLIEQANSHILQEKSIFCLSCRSSEFLEKQQLKGIGFGDLTTEWAEVISRREYNEVGAYCHPKGNIRKEDIEYANTILVDVVRHSLHDAITHQLSLQDLHLRLKLRFNRAIFNLVKDNTPSQVRWAANLLLEAKTEMKHFS